MFLFGEGDLFGREGDDAEGTAFLGEGLFTSSFDFGAGDLGLDVALEGLDFLSALLFFLPCK